MRQSCSPPWPASPSCFCSGPPVVGTQPLLDARTPRSFAMHQMMEHGLQRHDGTVQVWSPSPSPSPSAHRSRSAQRTRGAGRAPPNVEPPPLDVIADRRGIGRDSSSGVGQLLDRVGTYLFLTWSVTEVECVSGPLVPVIVRVLVPGGVDMVVATVRVEPLGTGFVAKVQVAPGGQPFTASDTLPVKPLVEVTVTA